MMEIRVSAAGGVRVLDFRIDGNLHRSRDYGSWRELLTDLGPRWSIDTRRSVWVRPQEPEQRTGDETV